MMNALTFSYARKNLAEVMRTVSDDHAPVVVTHQNAKPVIIMSLEDYQSFEETGYLLRNPTGAHRLLEVLKNYAPAKVTSENYSMMINNPAKVGKTTFTGKQQIKPCSNALIC